MLVSLLLVAFGLPAFVSTRSYPLMLALVLVTGLGQGGIDLSANLMVSAAYPKNNTRMLNLLHFFFGLGAFFGPALVGLAIASTGSGMVIHWVAAGVFLVLAVIVFTLRADDRPTQPVTIVSAGEVKNGKSVYLSPILWGIGLFILFYVGAEYGVGSWATRFMGLTTQMADQNGALVTSAYWGALTLGRLAGAAGSRRLSRTRLLAISLAGSLVGAIGLIFSLDAVVPTILFIILTGFSFGTIYPTSVAVTVGGIPTAPGQSRGAAGRNGQHRRTHLPGWQASCSRPYPRLFTHFSSASLWMLLILLFVLGKYQKSEPGL